jgi:hypothetical protein
MESKEGNIHTESDEYSESSTDEGKRKRNPGNTEEGFRKNRKTLRTPEKRKPTANMEEIKDFMKNMMEEMKQCRREFQEHRDEMRALKKENQDIKEELTVLRKRVDSLEYVEEKIEQMERKNRKNKIVINGIKLESKNEETNKSIVENFIKLNLKVDMKANNLIKINETVSVVEVDKFENKLEIMRNKHKLKTISEKVYINNDLTEQERKIQKVIQEIAKEERAKNQQVKIGYQKIIINGKKYI